MSTSAHQLDLYQTERQNRTDYWLHPGIVVKILNKKLVDGKYYKKKAVVKKVIDHYIAELELIGSGDILRLDQQEMETVIPNIGGKVMVVNGAYRGQVGQLVALHVETFKAEVKIERGPNTGQTEMFEYEDISKTIVK